MLPFGVDRTSIDIYIARVRKPSSRLFRFMLSMNVVHPQREHNHLALHPACDDHASLRVEGALRPRMAQSTGDSMRRNDEATGHRLLGDVSLLLGPSDGVGDGGVR
jgi:hypothetical protein